MHQQTSDQQRRMRGSTCSSETELESNKFDMVNNIYQLHSIINRTSIEKQKYKIAYVSLLQTTEEMVQNKQHETDQLTGKLDKSAKQITFLKERLEQEKTRANGLARQRDSIGKQLDSVIESESKSGGQKITVNMVIADYGRLKKQLTIKNELAQRQGQQLRMKEIKIKDQAQQLISLKQNLAKQVECLRNQLSEQRIKFQECIDSRLVASQHERGELLLKIEKQFLMMSELQIQNRSNMSRILDLQARLAKYHHINLEINMIKQLQNKKISDEQCRAQRKHTMQKEMLDQRENKYQQILNENHQLLQESSRKKTENAYLLSKCEHYVKQIQEVRKQLILAKQQNDKFKQVSLNSQDFTALKKSSSIDHLSKFQQALLSFENEKKKLMKLLVQETDKCKKISNKNEQKQQQIQMFTNRIKILQASLSHTEQQHQQIVRQFSLAQQQIYSIKLENSKLKTEVSSHAEKDNIVKLQIQARQTEAVKMAPTKYEDMISKIKRQDEQIHMIIKQKAQLQEMLQNSDHNCLKIKRELSQKQLETDELNRKINRISNEYQESTHEIQRLHTKYQKMRKQTDQQIHQLIATISTLKQCITDIKQRNSQFDQVQLEFKAKTKNKTKICLSKIIDVIIMPHISAKPHISEKMRAKLQTTKRTVEGLTRPSSEEYFLNTSMPQMKPARPPTKENNSGHEHIVKIRQMMRKQQDENLERTIRQLKRQKRELSRTRNE